MKRLVSISLILAIYAVLAGSSSTVDRDKAMVIVIDTSAQMKPLSSSVKSRIIKFIYGLEVGWHVSLGRFDLSSEILANIDLNTDLGKFDKDLLDIVLSELKFTGPKSNFDSALKATQLALSESEITKNAAIVIFSNKTPVSKDLTALAKKICPQKSRIYFVDVKESAADKKQIEDENVVLLETTKDNVQMVLQQIKEDLEKKIGVTSEKKVEEKVEKKEPETPKKVVEKEEKDPKIPKKEKTEAPKEPEAKKSKNVILYASVAGAVVLLGGAVVFFLLRRKKNKIDAWAHLMDKAKEYKENKGRR